MSNRFMEMQLIAQHTDEVAMFAHILGIQPASEKYKDLIYILGAVRLNEIQSAKKHVDKAFSYLPIEMKNNVLPLIQEGFKDAHG